MRADELKKLEERLQVLERAVEKERVRVDVEENQRTKLRLSVTSKREQNQLLLKVVELFKSLGGVHQKELLDKLETFISYGLAYVFGSQYKFETELSMEGKDLRVDFFVVTNELQTGVTDAKGGGVAEVVSILLQLFFVVVLGDALSPFLLLDTAMVHLSERYHSNMSALLKQLCERLDIQIILLAHAGEYGDYADCLYRFSQHEGQTIAERIK